MVKTDTTGHYLLDGLTLVPDHMDGQNRLVALLGAVPSREEARLGTMTHRIIGRHIKSQKGASLKILFDALASHDMNTVSIIQTARASGLKSFPVPYVMCNCHNALCAVGGTMNDDDHQFGFSAAVKYGGIYVPANQAVIHQFMRETQAAVGKMILVSDNHARYGTLGTLAIAESGGELVKQLLGHSYDMPMPEVVGVYLTGEPETGVGPMDIALAMIGAVSENGFVKDKVMEFFGDGVRALSVDARHGVDVMMAATGSLSSVWTVDEKVRQYYDALGRMGAYADLSPESPAYYDSLVTVDLSQIRPMIAMPFSPSNVYAIEDVNANLRDILSETEERGSAQLAQPLVRFSLRDKVVNGRLLADQAIVGGCAGGTFENLCDMADMLKGGGIGSDAFTLAVCPASSPVMHSLAENGALAKMLEAGVTVRQAMCGACFGACDTPYNGAFSVRHVTKNTPNREGSKPLGLQTASVALMDAKSIAATALNKGFLTAATDINPYFSRPKFYFNKTIYENRVYNGRHNADETYPLRMGVHIVDWPDMPPLAEDVLIRLASFITDPVTTIDELIPSGETAAYRSNPLALSEFTLSNKDPFYVSRAKGMLELENMRQRGALTEDTEQSLTAVYAEIKASFGALCGDIGLGSAIYAANPGEGSAREQAASCQRVLGGIANFAGSYASKTYPASLVNWGILPFILADAPAFKQDDYIFIPDIRDAVIQQKASITAYNASRNMEPFAVKMPVLSDTEREIILVGSLINYYYSGT